MTDNTMRLAALIICPIIALVAYDMPPFEGIVTLLIILGAAFGAAFDRSEPE